MTKWYRTTDRRPDDAREVLICSAPDSVYIGWFHGYARCWYSECDRYGPIGIKDPLCWAELPKPTIDFLMSCRGPSQTVKDQVSEDARALHERLKQQGVNPTDYEV